jgi:chromate transporter
MSGLAAAGVGMTLMIGVSGARRLRGAIPAVLAATVFVLIGLLQWPMLPVVLSLAPISIGLAWFREDRRDV